MAHFAKLSDTSQVLSVHVVNNSDILNADGVEDESVGQAYLEKLHNWPAHMWVQTSYNTADNIHKLGGTPLRGNYAGPSFTWDEDDNIFWPKKPFTSWVKHNATASWKSPIGDAPALTDEQAANFNHYDWNESDQSWDLKTTPSKVIGQ